MKAVAPAQQPRIEVVGVSYWQDRFGIVHQEDLTVGVRYDRGYVQERYDALPDHGRALSLLRAGFVIGALGEVPHSVLDVGYGNGDFLALMRDYGSMGFGLDVSGYPLPDGCHTWTGQQHICLTTFFDSLEHIPDLRAVGRRLEASFVAITVPWFDPAAGEEWFAGWKHRRPGEHLHHFSPGALQTWMAHIGYRMVAQAPIEDAIRKPVDARPNTFTAVFERA